MADPIQIEAPDGSLVEFPAGTSDNVIQGVMAQHYPAPQASPAQSTLSSIREAIHAPTRILENGFLMGLGDRARAGMDALIGNGGYAGNLANEQAQTQQFKSDHRIAAPIIEGVGGLATPLGVLGATTKGASLGAKTLYGAGTGAGLGGILGATNSEDWTDLPQTFKDAVFGAGGGALLGGAFPSVAAGVGAAYNGISNALRSAPGISRGALPHLLEAYKADTAPAIQAELDRLGPQATLADTGPALLGKAQGASLNSDEGRSVLQSALKQRDLGTNQRIQGDVNAALGPAEDPQTVSNAILAHRQAIDNVAYPAALDNAPAVDTAAILRQLDAMIPKSVGMERKALENMRGMLTKAAPPLAAPSASVPGKPAANTVADDVAAIRAKYGDAAAAAYEKQNAPASTPVAAAPSAAPQPVPPSLLQFIASKGGLAPHPELDAIGLANGHRAQIPGQPGFFGVVKKNGANIDRMREAAEQAGYLRVRAGEATSTPTDFLDAIDAELRGQKRYPEGYEGAQTKKETVARSERDQAEYDRHIQGFESDLASAGHGQLGPDVKKRAVDLMATEGMDADTAVEHALAQLEQEDAAAIRPASNAAFPGDAGKVAPALAPKPAPSTSPERVPQTDAGVLHKIKQELDNVIQYDAPGLGVPAGALSRQQGTLKLFRGQLNSALEKGVPGYREANANSAALAKRAEAVQAGTQFLGSGKTIASPERFAAEFSPLSQGEKIALAKGSRGNIERVLGTKANDLQALRGELQGEGGWNTAKLATVHGQEAADQLIKSVERNLKFRETYNDVVRNSQTAQRQAAAKAMKPEPSSETPLLNPNMSLTGLAGTVGKKAVSAAFNALLRQDPTKNFGEVARILSAQGPQRDAYHQALTEALARRATNAATSSKVGNAAALTALALANGYLRDPSNRLSHRK